MMKKRRPMRLFLFKYQAFPHFFPKKAPFLINERVSNAECAHTTQNQGGLVGGGIAENEGVEDSEEEIVM